MDTKLAFIDVETTGLNPLIHEAWEVGLAVRSDEGTQVSHWLLPVAKMQVADLKALEIGAFHQRHPAGYAYRPDPQNPEGLTDPTVFARDFAAQTLGCHWVGMVPSFDEGWVRGMVIAAGLTHGWHYHLIDVEALAAGYISGRAHSVEAPSQHPPWTSHDLSRAVGVDPSDFPRHTALGDVAWAMAIYDAVMG